MVHPTAQTHHLTQESLSIVLCSLRYVHHGPFDGCQPLRSEGGGHAIPKWVAGSSPVLGKDERPFLLAFTRQELVFSVTCTLLRNPAQDAAFPVYRFLAASVG